MLEHLPHLSGFLNTIVAILVFAGWRAIRRGDKVLHPRLMLAAIATGAAFVVSYVSQTTLLGHARFPGDDWVRAFFVVLLLTHTILAVIVVPMIVVTVSLALKERFEVHRRWARVTFPIWAYVAVTGVMVYAMNNWVRPN